MRTTNNRIVVIFDPKPETPLNLIIPERYNVHEEEDEDDENGTRHAITTDRRLINPQTVTVVHDNGYWLDTVRDNYPEQERDETLRSCPRIYAGKKYFVYYGAYETASWLSETEAIIDAKFVFFQLDPVVMLPGIYLGDEVFDNGERTNSGIWLREERKDGLRVKLTHVPKGGSYKVGQTVITYNDKNYWLRYGGHKHLKITEDVVVGIEQDGQTWSVGNNLIVEYLPDEDANERLAENARRKEQLDFFLRLGCHIEPGTCDPLPEPKDVEAIATLTGQRMKVWRNVGVPLPNNQWIINKDTIIWKYGGELAEGAEAGRG